jgi:hypothetical protein
VGKNAIIRRSATGSACNGIPPILQPYGFEDGAWPDGFFRAGF